MKAQPIWFRAAAHGVIMKDMCPNMLDDTLSMRWVKIDGGLALWTSQSKMLHVGRIGVKLLDDKTCFP